MLGGIEEFFRSQFQKLGLQFFDTFHQPLNAFGHLVDASVIIVDQIAKKLTSFRRKLCINVGRDLNAESANRKYVKEGLHE